MEMITPGQVMSLESALKELAGKDEKSYCYIVSQLLDREVDDLYRLTHQDWTALRAKLYPNWQQKDWLLSDKARREIAQAYEQYREEVIGQKRLF